MAGKKYISRLSWQRITASLFLLVLTPLIALFLNTFVNNMTISYTFALNFIGWILVIYDWNLFGIHYNRFKHNLLDGFIYTVIGIVLIGGWGLFNIYYLQGNVLLPDVNTMKEYAFAAPAILFAYSFMKASIISITFKCTTDHFDIRDRELLIILLSGFLYGLILTFVFTPWNDLALIVRTYLYNVILVGILSYLYNQSSSFIPGLISVGLLTVVFSFVLA